MILNSQAYEALDRGNEEVLSWDELAVPTEMTWMDYITGEFVDEEEQRRAYKRTGPMVYGAPRLPQEELSNVEAMFLDKYLVSFNEDEIVEGYLVTDYRYGFTLRPDTQFRFAAWALRDFPSKSVDLSRGWAHEYSRTP